MPAKAKNRLGTAMRNFPDRGTIVQKVLTLTSPHIVEEGGDVKKGLPMYKACEIVGITPQTLMNWRREDKDLAAIWDNALEARKTFMNDMS